MTSRRKFIATSALATAGLLSSASMFRSLGKQKTLNIGIIGTGARGTGIISVLNDVPHIKVVAVSDVIPFRLEEAEKLSGARGYTDYRRLLEHKGLEAVVIATPFGLHDQHCIDALNAGMHVYCEKTLMKGITETQNVLDTYNKTNGVIFQTGHQYNSSDCYKKVEKIVKSGYLGDITGFLCQWNRNGSWRRPVPDPKWERMINWRMYKEYSGGLVAELCSHQIDFINRVLGQYPKRISGFGGIDHWKDGRETYDNIRLNFEYPDGTDANFMCTTTNSYEGYKIKILGSNGTIVMDTHKAEIFMENKTLKKHGIVDGVSGATMQAWKKGQGAPIEASNENITLQAFEQFYQSITEDATVYADLESGAQTAKCVQMSLDAMYESKIAYWKDYPELMF